LSSGGGTPQSGGSSGGESKPGPMSLCVIFFSHVVPFDS
jgi:hypothetical protein